MVSHTRRGSAAARPWISSEEEQPQNPGSKKVMRSTPKARVVVVR